jgi:hypothetical protein
MLPFSLAPLFRSLCDIFFWFTNNDLGFGREFGLKKAGKTQSVMESAQFPHAFFAPWHAEFAFECTSIP